MRGISRPDGCRGAMTFRSAAAAFLLCAVVPFASAQDNWDTAHCGKKFRIATHISPPFTIIDQTKCDMKQRCPKNAWMKDGGGLTYKLIEGAVRDNLIKMCVEAGKASTDVEFDWYLPPESFQAASRAVNMVCNGDFQNETTPGNTTCMSQQNYKGASLATECKFRDHNTCESPGPDMVAGAVHALRERLDLLDFSTTYITVRQITVKRGQKLIPDIMKTFQCFDESLWFLGIFLEIAVVWVLILLVETWTNPQIDKSTPFAPFYDSLYWSFGSALDPGGPGKAPFTAGGRIFMCGHWFYLVIITSTYTGWSSLQMGHHTVVVRGPSWDDKVAEPRFKGTWRGGTSDERTTRSTQFKLLQNTMALDSKVKFNIYTAKNLESYQTIDGIKTELKMSPLVDPCKVKGAELGAFDLVMCGGFKNVEHAPDSMIYDAPSVYYEIRKRISSWKVMGWSQCKLKTVGDPFFTSGFGIGFPKNNHYSRAFSLAIQMAVSNGTVARLEKEYNVSSDDFPCHETVDSSTDSVLVDMVAGVFVFSGLMLAAGTVQGMIGGLPSGRTMRVLAACRTCKSQEMPESDEEEEDEVAEEEAERQQLPPPQTRVGQLCVQTQKLEDFLERLQNEI